MSDASPSACIDPDTAAGYAEHQLTPDEMREVEQHIDGCASCRELISAVAKTQWSLAEASSADPVPPVESVLPRGTRIGPFEIDRPLDAGGMGLVYAAHDARLDRHVALKCVRERRGRSEQLLQEARTMAQLAHPNVVAVYDVIDAHGQIFLAMELVVGRSVRQWLDAAPRGWKQIVDVFLAAGAGLAAAHAADIIHGDVKPANMMFGDDGRVRITDFGLSSSGAGEAQEPAGPRGTPAYMAPEQRDGAPCDARGDQYAFCASLHEAVFGALPGRVPSKQPRVPRALRRILARGMSVDPRARYQSMTLLLRDLRATRSAKLAWVMAAAAIALVVGALAYGFGGHRVEAKMCEAFEPRLASPWNAATRWMVRWAFENTKLPYAPQIFVRVEANLDGWTSAFEAARRQTCETGWFRSETPLEQFSTQLSCLADRAAEAQALVGVFHDAPDATIILNAIAATEQLAPLTRCATPPAQRSVASIAPARQQLTEQFARVHALLASGKFQNALPIARDLVTAADATGDPALQSAALVSLGSTQVHLSAYEAAGPNLMQAIRLAETAQDDRVRAQAWVNLVQNEYGHGHYEQVLFMKAPALGVAERVGDRFLTSELLLLLGGALNQLGKASEAQPLFEQAVQLRRLYGDKDGRLASALSALGNAYAMQGNLDAGIAAHRQAVETAEAALGASHPTIGTLHGNLGDDFLYGLQPQAAVDELEKAAAILEAANGPTHRSVALALTDLGLARLEAGQLERAATTLERADALWMAVNPKHPSRAEALMGKQLALEALGRPTSVADLETALALGQQLPPFERARIQFALGRASSGPNAAALVDAAVKGLGTSTLPLIQRELARAKQWQQDHGSKP
jgi:eukaryotic-like serine/threonine-protein kinase